MRRLDCFDRIKQVTRGHATALGMMKALMKVAEEHPEYLHGYELNLVEMKIVVEQLHEIYFARMFASFESSLRHFWRTSVKDTKPATEQLISSVAARLGVPEDALDAVQEIRDFRNSLIHDEHEVKRVFTIDEASRFLNIYLSPLPLNW